MLFVYDGLRSQDHIQIGRGVLFLFYVQLLGCLAIPIEYGRKAKQVSRPFCFMCVCLLGLADGVKVFCVMYWNYILRKLNLEKNSTESKELREHNDEKKINSANEMTTIVPEKIEFNANGGEMVFKKIDSVELSKMTEIFVTQEQSNNFLSLISQGISSAANVGIYVAVANSVKGLFRATVSPDLLMRYADGTVSSIVQSGGRVTSHAGFVSASVSNVFTPMIIFQIASFVTGQYYMNGINESLEKIHEKLDSIIQKIEADKRGKVYAAKEILYVLSKQNQYTVDDLVRLRNAQHDVLSTYYYYKFQLERNRNEIKFETEQSWTIDDVRETISNIEKSEFLQHLEMASLTYDLYVKFEITYLKMLFHMSKYDISYVDKIRSEMDLLLYYKDNNLMDKEIKGILTKFNTELDEYFKGREKHASFLKDEIKEEAKKEMDKIKEKYRLFEVHTGNCKDIEQIQNLMLSEREVILQIEDDGSVRLYQKSIENPTNKKSSWIDRIKNFFVEPQNVHI